jgi:alcohol dehydrogenase YqhD (iron-dependent ADH family)
MFYSYTPTRLMNGIGAFEKLPHELANVNHLIVLHGSSMDKFTKNINWGGFNFGKLDLTTQFIRVPDGDPTLAGLVATRAQITLHQPFLLAVGGGRVIDFAKGLATLHGNSLSANQLFETSWQTWKNSLSIGVVATRPGSGSEFNNGFVISDQNGWKKSLFSLTSYPKFCVHDPIFFSSLNESDFLQGMYDALIHVLDQYVADRPYSYLVDEWSLGCLKVLGKLLHDATTERIFDFNRLAWVSSMITSSLLSRGVSTSWRCHEFVHAYSSIADSAHGPTLMHFSPKIFERHCPSVPRLTQALHAFSITANLDANTALSKFTEMILAKYPELSISTESYRDSAAILAGQCPSFSLGQIKDLLNS